MQVSEIMTQRVESISPQATLQEAARRMVALDIGPLPVCENDHLIGIITDRDITTRSTACGADPCTASVREAMTTEVVYCFEDQDLAEAGRLMQEKQIRRLVVLNREKRLVGILSLADLAVESEDPQVPRDTLEAVSESGHDPQLRVAAPRSAIDCQGPSRDIPAGKGV